MNVQYDTDKHWTDIFHAPATYLGYKKPASMEDNWEGQPVKNKCNL